MELFPFCYVMYIMNTIQVHILGAVDFHRSRIDTLQQLHLEYLRLLDLRHFLKLIVITPEQRIYTSDRRVRVSVIIREGNKR